MKVWDTPYDVPLPRMTTRSELGFCRYITDFVESPQPVIADLGPWLGATTQALIDGCPTATIHSVDIFKWASQYMERAYTRFHNEVCSYRQGDSFVIEFLENINWQLCPGLEHFVHVQDLTKYKWPGEDFDIIFCDALKSKGITTNFILNWLPSLKVGGWLIDQDFRWMPQFNNTPFVVCMWSMREYFRPAWYVKDGTLVAWEKISEPPAGMYKYLVTESVLTMPEQSQRIMSAMHYWKELIEL